ncbi:MAG: hypothetical protein N2F24_06800, partial [Deltaproteobacteria bacterium]
MKQGLENSQISPQMAPKRQPTRKRPVRAVGVPATKRRRKFVENVEKSDDEMDDLVENVQDISPVESSEHEVSDSIPQKLVVKIPKKPVKVISQGQGQGTSKGKKAACAFSSKGKGKQKSTPQSTPSKLAKNNGPSKSSTPKSKGKGASTLGISKGKGPQLKSPQLKTPAKK